MSTRHDYQQKLKEVLVTMESKDYFNGTHTVRARYPLGSQERANLVAEAHLYLALIKQEDES